MSKVTLVYGSTDDTFASTPNLYKISSAGDF